jgi:hypothetical protein
MANQFKYRPMLRSKAGEAEALTNLTPPAKGRMMPVIHMVHKPPATFGASIVAAWATRPMALDGTFHCDVTGSPHLYNAMFDHIGKGKVDLIPSIDFNASAPYLTVVQKLKDRYSSGLIVKAKPNQLQNVGAWIASQGWQPSEIDLVVYLTEIGGYDPDMLEPVVVQGIKTHIPNPSPWRSITLSASAAPKDMSNLKAGRNEVPRNEWRVWSGVSNNVPYQVDYADFASVHPDLTDPPGYVMATATVSVRYATDDYWIVIKGKPTTGKTGQKMTPQYRAHAKTLVADAKFGGLVGCWSDGKIQQIAKSTSATGGAGGRAEWVCYGVSRHISLVADRLP